MHWQEFDNPEKEKERLEKALSENPADANACYELGTVYAYVHDWATAKEFCDKAIGLDPKNITYHACRSFVNSHLEEHGEAIEDLVTIIELGGDESDYYVDVAQGAQRGMDKEYAVSRVVDLRKEGKDRIAGKLEEWLIKPFIYRRRIVT